MACERPGRVARWPGKFRTPSRSAGRPIRHTEPQVGTTVNARPSLFLVLLAAATVAAAPAARTAEPPVGFGSNEPTPADRDAIETLLRTYQTAVSTRNEAAFIPLLLNDQVPFAGTFELVGPRAARPLDTRRFADFRKAVFGNGEPFTQTFSNIHILQDGILGQVSLDFVNTDRTGHGGWGWKIIQLLKVDGRWKIASEFYTGHPLPGTS